MISERIHQRTLFVNIFTNIQLTTGCNWFIANAIRKLVFISNNYGELSFIIRTECNPDYLSQRYKKL